MKNSSKLDDTSKTIFCRGYYGVEPLCDVATRPANPLKFETPSKWIQGPSFLKISSKDWHNFEIVPPQNQLEEECKPCMLTKLKVNSNIVIDFYRFSSYFKLTQVTSIILRVEKRWTMRSQSAILPTGFISVEEIDTAMSFICRLVQQEAFPVEITLLEAKKSLPNQSPYLESLFG